MLVWTFSCMLHVCTVHVCGVLGEKLLCVHCASSESGVPHHACADAADGRASPRCRARGFSPCPSRVRSAACASREMPQINRCEELHAWCVVCLGALPLRWRDVRVAEGDRCRLHVSRGCDLAACAARALARRVVHITPAPVVLWSCAGLAGLAVPVAAARLLDWAC